MSGVMPSVPESRPSIDSSAGGFDVAERGFILLKHAFGEVEVAFAAPVAHMLEVFGVTEGRGESDVEKEEMDDDGYRPLRELFSKYSTVIKDCTISMDSEACVTYTQSSRLSDAPATRASSRPALLNPTQHPSPLLHMSWMSWGSSSGFSSSAAGGGPVYLASAKSSLMVHTHVHGAVS